MWQNICLNKIEWVWEWGVGVCIQFVFITQWKLLWMIFTSLINICSKKRNTTNDGNGTCTHVINAFYTFNMTFSNKMSWTKLNLVFTTAIFKKNFLSSFSLTCSYPLLICIFVFTRYKRWYDYPQSIKLIHSLISSPYFFWFSCIKCGIVK